MRMTTNNKHLVRAGHEFAAAMSDDTPIITIAKMLTDLASALDVQSARSDALAAKLNDVCAENAALKEQSPDVRSPAMFEAIEAAQRLLDEDCPELAMIEAFEILKMKRTPNTDAWVNEQRAVGVDKLADFCATANNGYEINPDVEEIRIFAAQLRGSQV
ncbi:hypothetical protein [Atlantibacter hermannii]|uniref:hypothetical protein n=1 Tax=Atlantibacter hermannii TaxID=565 RepID=UPI00289D19B9|nr:hypothetical protein [Atlantibacter hermannii]